MLSPVACRVLGSLLEKERTVPATYPLTMNALVAACNQTTGRDPIMAVDEAAVTAAIDELRAAGLARLVHASHGARSVKYRQAAIEALELDDPRRAVLTGLLLRGPQTSGRAAVARPTACTGFASVDEVEATLAHLAERDLPLVVHLAPAPRARRNGAGVTPWPDRRRRRPGRRPAERSRPLAALVGVWSGAGAGSYPTIDGVRLHRARSRSSRCRASRSWPTARPPGPATTAAPCTASRASCA